MASSTTTTEGRRRPSGARPGPGPGAPGAPGAGDPSGGAAAPPPGPRPLRVSRSALAFGALCLLCLAFGAVYLLRAARRGGAPGAATALPALTLEAVRAQPYAVLRSTLQDGTFGKLVLVPLDRPESGRYVAGLDCERVYFDAGRGICLQADRGVITTYNAVLFDDQLRPGKSFPLTGIPSRARISPDGRFAAVTVFVTGHSYADATFSTHTTIVDSTSGEELAEMESFAVYRDGERIQSPDFNFWGVTFARDTNRIYATLRSAGKTYLVQGDVRERRFDVLRDAVECPSLSPDNTRIAFKRLATAGARPVWKVAILDLRTMTETVLPQETHSVDDQIEWLDNATVVYGLPAETATPSARTDVWSLAVDGSAAPRLLIEGGWSPSVSRG
jgi:hypothetical protein